MKIIDLLNKIANGEIEDKRTFIIRFENELCRSIYYDKEENNCMCCLKNCSDDYSIYDDISFDTEIEIIEDAPKQDKKIEKIKMVVCDSDLIDRNHFVVEYLGELKYKINEIIDKINGEENV